jgi:hypothetical protein
MGTKGVVSVAITTRSRSVVEFLQRKIDLKLDKQFNRYYILIKRPQRRMRAKIENCFSRERRHARMG